MNVILPDFVGTKVPVFEIFNEDGSHFGWGVSIWDTTTIYHGNDDFADWVAASELADAYGEL